MDIPNLFIIGMPRSGTKLLRAILGNHSRIFIPDIELVIIPRLLLKFGVGDLSEADVKNVIDELKASVFFFYYKVDKKFDFSVLSNGRNVKEIVSLLFYELGGSEIRYDFYGDKSPGNIEHSKVLFENFPDSRFIHIVRDPRDYSLSVSKAWGKSKLRAAVRWRDSIQLFRDHAADFKGRVLEIRYEDLLDFPVETVMRCTDFLGLDYEPDMVTLLRGVENLGDARSPKIESANKDKYLKDMSSSCVRRIESYTVTLLECYGYSHGSAASEAVNMPPILMKILSLWDAVNLVVFNVREHGPCAGFRKIFSALRSKPESY